MKTNINKVIKKAIKESINRFFLNEAQWAFHHLRNGEHDMKPYGSENKYICYHETGQFGSGTYFSTFNGAYDKTDDMEKYGDSNPNKNPNFIKIGEGTYRVDFDLYKNLYRVKSEKQGDILHTMCGDLNGFYSKVSGYGLGEYRPHTANFNNGLLYQKIKTNADALGLKCPSYLKLTRMAQEHAKAGKEKPQSFSTVFMEYNGFNGVNVCGIDKFDNTRHGSVIYDLSKVSDEITPLGNVGWVTSTKGGHTHTYATNKWDNWDLINNLNGDMPTLDIENMSEKEKMRVLKNIIDSNKRFSFINPYQIKKYFGNSQRIMRYLFKSMFNHEINDEFVLDDKMMDLIVEYNQEYFVNYQTEEYGLRYKSFLIHFLDKFTDKHFLEDDNRQVFEEYLNHLLSILNRDLTEYEQDYIENSYYRWCE